MRIGIDLDNTLIFYDEAFARAAIESSLLPADFRGGKSKLREAIRALPDGEQQWQALQGHVYGAGILEATLFPGAMEFLQSYKECEFFIVSHKTEFAHFDETRTNLREAATAWLRAQNIFSPIPEANVFFANTREEKVLRIADLNLDWFIDDLPEVFLEPHFPACTKKILLSAEPHTGAALCRNWHEIHAFFAASRLIGKPIDAIAHTGNGGNSRIYKITAGNQTFALKRYPVIAQDARDRLNTERRALEFLAAENIKNVPKFITSHAPYALLEWIDGALVTAPNEKDIDAAVHFLAQIFSASKSAPHDLPLASEPCLSAADLLAHIHTRLKALKDVARSEPSLDHFLIGYVLPALVEREATARRNGNFATTLKMPLLIPADFGFHNTLKKSDGSLIFLDFEYFGWDDPARLLADILLHPATALSESLKTRLYRGVMRHLDTDAAARFTALYPLIGLRWALILLNEFLPERWQARAQARGEIDAHAAKQRQLKKAKHMLEASTDWTLAA
jgi:hypothetical protein